MGPAGIWGVQQLLSIGDSLDEHEAATNVAQCCPCYVKTLRLLDKPSMTQLAQQLELCYQHFSGVCYYYGNLDVDVGQIVGMKHSTHPRKLETLQAASGKTEDASEPMQKRRRVLPWADRL